MMEREHKKPKWWNNIVWFVGIIVLAGICSSCSRIMDRFKAIEHYKQGNALTQAGKYEEALVEYEQAIGFIPNFEQALNNREYVLDKLKREPGGISSSCIYAMKIYPDSAEAWNCRGLARSDLKQYEQALKEYNQALAVDPEFFIGWYNKGEVLIKLGRYQEAISATQQVLKLKPDFYLAWTQICRALYELEQYQDAKAHCEESRNIEPDYEPTLVLLEKIEIKLDSESLRS